ncbi:hypothetical protein X975_16737, partial [Stegodyphus mimosarum]
MSLYCMNLKVKIQMFYFSWVLKMKKWNCRKKQLLKLVKKL